MSDTWVERLERVVDLTTYNDEDHEALHDLLNAIDTGEIRLVRKTEYDTETGLPAKKFNAMDVEDMQENVVNDNDDYSDLREPMA